MTKQEIRDKYLNKRKQLSEAEVTLLSRQICDQFFAHFDLSFVKTLHVFLPVVRFNEPDTWLIIDRIRREFPQIRIVLPRVNQATGLIDNLFFEGLHQLEENPWGIREPRQGVPAEAHIVDMAIVPLLAFDKTGYRIGYGKGYYDRFLVECKKDCQKIGLSLFDPMEKVPYESHDIKLDFAVTPDKVISFK